MAGWRWILGGIYGLLLVVVVVLGVLTLVFDLSVWWFVSFFGFLLFITLFGVFVWLVAGRKPDVVVSTIQRPKDAKERIQQLVRRDSDRPDEFVINNESQPTEGQAGSSRTPVLLMTGTLLWSGLPMIAMQDLSDKNRYQILRNFTVESSKEELRKFALNPEQEEVTEEVSEIDLATGRPVTRKRTTKMTSTEKAFKEAEEKEEKAEGL